MLFRVVWGKQLPPTIDKKSSFGRDTKRQRLSLSSSCCCCWQSIACDCLWSGIQSLSARLHQAQVLIVTLSSPVIRAYKNINKHSPPYHASGTNKEEDHDSSSYSKGNLQPWPDPPTANSFGTGLVGSDGSNRDTNSSSRRRRCRHRRSSSNQSQDK